MGKFNEFHWGLNLIGTSKEILGWNFEHAWEALIPKNHDIPIHSLIWIGSRDELRHSKPTTVAAWRPLR